MVVGAGYTGTEVAAQGVLLTDALIRNHPRLARHSARWLLVDVADRVLPGLDPGSVAPQIVLRNRGVELRLGTSVKEATGSSVVLSDGSDVPTRSLIWCVGVRPEPLVAGLGLKTTHGRLDVDEYLNVPGHPKVFPAATSQPFPTSRPTNLGRSPR